MLEWAFPRESTWFLCLMSKHKETEAWRMIVPNIITSEPDIKAKAKTTAQQFFVFPPLSLKNAFNETHLKCNTGPFS